MYVYTVYKYQIEWELTPFSFLRGAAFAGGSLKHSSVVKRTLGKSHDFDCAFDYDLIGQILFDFRSHSHLTFLREVEVMTLTLVMTKVMTTFITRYLPLTCVFFRSDSIFQLGRVWYCTVPFCSTVAQ